MYINAFIKPGQIMSICSKHSEQNQNSDIHQWHNSVTNKQNMEDSNPNIYLINIYTFTKVGEILSICPQDIAKKHNYVTNQGLKLCYKFVKDNR